ncbi:hypothetical protein P2G88_02715 [Aliiglaciecola sp. CAU 1673]|uniref:hypothetical protein n=1 Tax=Aliiglaciecola sp. CAU 1673 TaxID=3032595 RepID=UPI0023D99AB8|nr:hypothetical protein [Aliiglaciecola sp. CAU 1673]MDF2177156.1 hypothetical protein [Aliiglaciecola sp. CAU 1673]
MTKTTKAVLLSALLLPGSGQLLLKRYFTGVAFIVIALFSVTVVLSAALEQAQEIANQILQGKIAPDSAAIAEALAQQSQQADSTMLQLCTYLLIANWAISILHALWIGYKSPKLPPPKHSTSH